MFRLTQLILVLTLLQQQLMSFTVISTNSKIFNRLLDPVYFPPILLFLIFRFLLAFLFKLNPTLTLCFSASDKSILKTAVVVITASYWTTGHVTNNDGSYCYYGYSQCFCTIFISITCRLFFIFSSRFSYIYI